MRFASLITMARKQRGLVLLLLCGVFTMGCLTTDKIDFVPEENLPPSIVSAPGAEHPLNEIGALDLDAPIPPGETADYVLETLIRDANIDQDLEYRLFRDPVSGLSPPILSGTIDQQDAFERDFPLPIPYALMGAPGICHRFELFVTGQFKNFVEPMEPEEEGDLDVATWWVRVTDDDTPFIAQECQ